MLGGWTIWQHFVKLCQTKFDLQHPVAQKHEALFMSFYDIFVALKVSLSGALWLTWKCDLHTSAKWKYAPGAGGRTGMGDGDGRGYGGGKGWGIKPGAVGPSIAKPPSISD